MTTADLICSRLPNRPLVSPGDVAAAFGFSTTNPIISAIQCGRLDAVRTAGRYFIARECAERYIRAEEGGAK